MDRRSFLRKGAVGAVGGWLGLRVARSEAETLTHHETEGFLQERDESWDLGADLGDTPVHIIEVKLPFDDPTMMFIRGKQRIVVPRQNELELRYGKADGSRADESLEVVLRDRAKVLRAIPDANDHALLLIIVHTPAQTQYGMAAGLASLTIDNMLISAPARMLFNLPL